MNDPKKLVPPCDCPPDSFPPPLGHAAFEPNRYREPDPLSPEPLQFTMQVRLDSPPVNSEPSISEEAIKAFVAGASDAMTARAYAKTEPQGVPEAEGDPSAPDAAAAFVEAAVAVDRRAFTSTAEIMAAARVWCAENDLPAFHPRALAEQLRRRRGVQAHSNGQRRGWRGVKLR